MSKLAILGGAPTITAAPPAELFRWPIIGKEDEDAVLDVVRTNNFSGIDISEQFCREFAEWQGRRYAVNYCNGTASLAAAMFAIGLGAGDELICPTKTYWASVTQATSFGATAVFCNIDENMSLDPDDLERCITPRTKAIMVVHYFGYPCDMDRITAIAKKHGVKIIEDVSHAQGGMYKGRKLGTFGDVAAMSLMSTKAFAAGEMGILVTDDKRIYERAIAYGHYERNNSGYITESDEIKPFYHIALGGIKGRANQVCSALGRVQLKYFDQRCAAVREAMNYFFDRIDGVPGIHPLRVDESCGSNMGGFYQPQIIYKPEELGGLSSRRFAAALTSELGGTFTAYEGGNYCLHTHNYFKEFDLLGLGRPSRTAFTERDVREDDKHLLPSESVFCISVPRFVYLDKEWIELYASAVRKVAENYKELLADDEKGEDGGRWHGAENAANQKKEKK